MSKHFNVLDNPAGGTASGGAGTTPANTSIDNGNTRPPNIIGNDTATGNSNNPPRPPGTVPGVEAALDAASLQGNAAAVSGPQDTAGAANSPTDHGPSGNDAVSAAALVAASKNGAAAAAATASFERAIELVDHFVKEGRVDAALWLIYAVVCGLLKARTAVHVAAFKELIGEVFFRASQVHDVYGNNDLAAFFNMHLASLLFILQHASKHRRASCCVWFAGRLKRCFCSSLRRKKIIATHNLHQHVHQAQPHQGQERQAQRRHAQRRREQQEQEEAVLAHHGRQRACCRVWQAEEADGRQESCRSRYWRERRQQALRREEAAGSTQERHDGGRRR
jgi:hypothetical protein